MEQGIIENMKGSYRRRFIESLLSSDNTMTVKEFWKSYNIKDAIFKVANTCTDQTVMKLKNEFNKLWPEPPQATTKSSEAKTVPVSVGEIVQLCNSR